ncbi:hypothetical protein BQ8482_111533 [Mesorhizobium delmotii]|uniref:Uncharacterized protein n=1 Tax=Mesorhizobium delmotii TaxID=1631247 RepID=A0A2P9AER4_9HYPH|nr:hypothetical protein BQ8482_111533 [Mesorhizobium delmotii]
MLPRVKSRNGWFRAVRLSTGNERPAPETDMSESDSMAALEELTFDILISIHQLRLREYPCAI